MRPISCSTKAVAILHRILPYNAIPYHNTATDLIGDDGLEELRAACDADSDVIIRVRGVPNHCHLGLPYHTCTAGT